MSTQEDLQQFETLLESLWQNHCTLQYLLRCLHQRSQGKPEGSVKRHNQQVFD